MKRKKRRERVDFRPRRISQADLKFFDEVIEEALKDSPELNEEELLEKILDDNLVLSGQKDRAELAEKIRKASAKLNEKKEPEERKHLTQKEVNTILKAIRKHSKYPIRDQLLILLLFRHGLKLHQALCLTWNAFDCENNRLYIENRDICQPLSTEIVRLLTALKKKSMYLRAYVFVSQGGAPMAKQTAHTIIRNMGKKAGIPFRINSSMFRRGCVHHLFKRGVDLTSIQNYLGFTNFRWAVRYLPEDGKRLRRSLWEINCL